MTEERSCSFDCWRQTDTKYKKVKDCPCQLIKCPACGSELPEYTAECHEGLCSDCAISGCTEGDCCCESYEHVSVPPAGSCQRCGKRLVPLGNSRENGRDHNDWPTRKYRKKCWYKMITLEEEEDEESADK